MKIFHFARNEISCKHPLNFISNNFNGLKSSTKRIKIFEYFRDKLSNNEMIYFIGNAFF